MITWRTFSAAGCHRELVRPAMPRGNRDAFE
jgi:hypothetical protein